MGCPLTKKKLRQEITNFANAQFASADEEEQRELNWGGPSSSTPKTGSGRASGRSGGNSRSGSIPMAPSMWRKESVPIIENEAENEEVDTYQV